VGPTRRPELRPRGAGRRQSRAVPGRGFHSSTSQLNLSRLCPPKPRDVSHRKCSRHAESGGVSRPWFPAAAVVYPVVGRCRLNL